MSSQLDGLYNRLFRHIEKLTDFKSKNKNLQDVHDLIMELQKFQVEIEMENEELHNALEKLNNEIEKSDQSQIDLSGDQNLLESIIEGTSDAIYVKDLKGRYLLFNSTAEEITGKKSSEVLGKDDTFLFSPDEAKIVMDKDFSVMYDGTEQTYEETITTASGEKRTYLSTKGPLIDDNANIIGLFGIARDITERKQAEIALKESEERYYSLFRNNQAVMLLIEPKTGKIVDSNLAANSFYGYSREELLQKNIKDINISDEKNVSSQMRKAESGQKRHFIFKHKLANGKIKDVSVYTGPINFGNEKLLYSIVNDITEQKSAEDALKESKKRYRSIIENMQDGFFRLDKEGKIIMASPSLAKMYGFGSFQEMIGLTAVPLYKNIEDREQMMEELNKEGKLDDYEVEAVRGNESFWASVNAQFYYDDQGQIQGIEGFTRDITQRKKAEEELKQRSALLDISYEAIFSWEYDNGILSWNKGAERLYGFSKNETIGKVSHALLKTKFPIEFNEFMEELYNEKMWTGELVHTTKNGSKIIVESRHQLIQDSSGKTIVIETNRDITKRKKAEIQLKDSLNQTQQLAEELEVSNEELIATADELKVANEELRDQGETLIRLNRTLRALSDSDYAMMHAEDEAKYLDEVCRIIMEDCGYAMVWIGFVEEDENKTVRPVAYCGFDESYIENLNITLKDTERGRGPTGTAILTEKPYICRNMLNDPNFEPWREEAIKRGYASSLVVPLIADNKKLGAISIYSTEPDSFLNEEAELLAELANDLAFGITNLRLQAAHEKAEKELYENEKKLRTLFEILPIGVSIIDKNRNVVYENPALERILDISKKGFVKKSYEKRQYIKSDGTSMPDEEFPSVKAFKENKSVENIEMGIVKEDNSIIWTNISAIPLSFSDWNILITTFDITERKKAEKELEESEERYRLILETANSGVFLLDAENKIKYLNQRTMQLLGYSAHEMLDINLQQFLDTKGQINAHKLMKQWKKGLNALNEFKFICKDGSTFWTLFAASPVIDNNGKHRGTIGVITDINARKGVEKALIERERISKSILYDMMGMINKLMNEELKKEYEGNYEFKYEGKYEFT